MIQLDFIYLKSCVIKHQLVLMNCNMYRYIDIYYDTVKSIWDVYTPQSEQLANVGEFID